jgi:uncharacterized protein (DUF983 family)
MKTEFQAFIAQKCPRCRQGNMFKGHTYDPGKFATPNPTCSHCGLAFEIEPGFFTGAMYFSYVINVMIIAITGVTLNVLFDLDIYVVMGIVLGMVFLMVPLTFRYSRMMMMYLFSGVKYDPKYEQ